MSNLALLPTEELSKQRDELLSWLPIYEVANRHISLKKSGTKKGLPVFKAACPFHADDTPSFYIYEHDNTYHCFGCQAHGDSITFIRRIENLPDGKVFERARELAGILPKERKTRPAPVSQKKPSGWQSSEWQEFAEAELARCRELMREGSTAQLRFQRERGLTARTVEKFEIGWTGAADIKARVGGRFLLIRANSWIFPVRNSDGKIQMLKWRHTRPEDKKAWGKYGQLAGGEAAIFNQAAAADYLAKSDRLVLAKGEFDAMLLWQVAGIQAACHTTGEASHVDIADSFKLDAWSNARAFYVADRDTQGRKAAEAKQKLFPALRVCYPDKPYKDLGEQHVSGSGLSKNDVERILASALTLSDAGLAAGRRRATQKVETAEKTAQPETMELPEARVQLAKEVRTIFAHPRLARGEVTMISADPGVGKGFTVNQEATRRAREQNGATTGWFGSRLDMYSDQTRPADTWKLIEGRKAAQNTAGEYVDFFDPSAIPGSGNCTIEGASYHSLMAEKGYERDSYKYCQMSCPAYTQCQDRGYHSLNAKDGRNGYMTFAHLFTTLGRNYRYLVADELTPQAFVDLMEIDGADILHMRQFVVNGGMQLILLALSEMLSSNVITQSAPKVPDADDFSDFEIPQAGRLAGVNFYKRLDEICRGRFEGRGLLELIDLACHTQGAYGHDFFELLSEKSPEAVKKLPKNFWHNRQAEPGAGGLFDIIRAEARYALEGFGMEFVSRLELVRPGSSDKAKIVLHRRKYVPAELVAGKPFIVTDATGSATLLRTLLSGYFNIQMDKQIKRTNPVWKAYTPQIKTVAPRVEFPLSVQVTQDTRANFSKTSLSQSLRKDPKKRYWNKYVETVKGYLRPGELTLIVCAKAVKEYLREALLAAGLTIDAGYSWSLEHYGNLRGSNQYKDWDCVIQAGMYMPNPESIVRSARAIYGGDAKELDLGISRITRLHNYQDADGAGASDEVICFKDSRLQGLWEIDREDEHVQVAHRIRPLEAGESGAPKRIVLLFSTPLKALPVTTMITSDEEARQQGAFAQVNKRTMQAIEKMVPVIRSFIHGNETNAFCTPQMVREKIPVNEAGQKMSLDTVYKYWQIAVERANGVNLAVECIAPMPRERGEVRRSVQIAFKSGITPKIINTLIIFGVMPVLPKGWRPADVKETPQDAPPELPALPIEDAEKAPRSVRGQVDAYLGYLRVIRTAYEQALADRGGLYSAKATILRERYYDVSGVVDKLLARHSTKNQLQKAS